MEVKRYTLEDYKQALQGGLPDDGNVPVLAKGLVTEVKLIEDGEGGEQEPSRVREFIASTGAVDREGDTIDPMGWDVSNFLKSGVFLWAHDYSLPPIGEPLATWVEDKALRMRVKFPSADMPHPLGMGFGNTVMRMYDENLMKGVSVGFQSVEWKWAEDEERGAMAVDFLAQKLLEVSAVPVPANPEALIVARDKGINVAPIINWAEEARDKGVSLWVPKHALTDILDKSPRPAAVVVPDALDSNSPRGNNEGEDPDPSMSQKNAVSTIAPPGAETESEDLDEIYRKTVLDAIAIERKLIGSILRQVKLITKAGKVLSAANEGKLAEAAELIGTVLASAKPIEDDKGCGGNCDDCGCGGKGGEKPKDKPKKEAAEPTAEGPEYVRMEDLKDLVEGSLEKTLNRLTGRMPF